MGGRGVSAAVGFCMLSMGSGASAQAGVATGPALDIKAAVSALESKSAAKPAAVLTTPAPAESAAKVSALYTAPAAPSVTVALPSATQPSGDAAALAGKATLSTPSASLAAPAIATEAAWLQRNGWPLYALVDRYAAGTPLDEQANCIAIAVYHEARGESVEGQLAVARVIMNRAASGKYPASWCGTVKQPWQFSFVNPRTGHMPSVDESSASWRKALGVTRLAINNAVPILTQDVLWYHADYVAPSWGRRLSFVQKIGTHIFYRA
jgi:spore germination cell wall hydrolase CwlJ-like protein